MKDAVGNIDVLVHSLANGPEVAKPLLETSRKVRFSLELQAQYDTQRIIVANQSQR